jgi:broad specificity phosphatase PhoE
MTLTIYLIRHAETDKNATKINPLESSFVQEKNAYLNRNGKFQAMILGHYFRDKEIKIEAIYSSPLLRTFETAETIMKYINDDGTIDILVEDRLLSHKSKIKKEEKKDFSQNIDNKIRDRSTLNKIVTDLITDLLEWHGENNSTIILVTHNHIIDTFYNMFIEKDYYNKTNKKYKVNNCSVSCIEFENIDKYKVNKWNKTIEVVYKLV